MKILTLSATSITAGVLVMMGCGSDSRPSTDGAAQASTVSLHLTPFEKRLKLARLPPGIGDLPADSDSEDALAVHPGYPAFQPNVPSVINQGGPTMKHPQIVAVTWDGDVNRDAYEAFVDGIGNTTYWQKTTSEYGVGKAAGGGHVHISQQMTTISDEDLDNLVRTNVVNAATSGWPAPTDDTLYAIFLPPNALTFGGGNACLSGIGGYHTDSPMDPAAKDSKVFNYAVNINCPSKWDVNTVTLIASHEFVEAATDPFPGSNTGYVGFDPDHLAHDIMQEFQDETGDACEFFRSSDYVGGKPFAFGLQRSWSNRSAKEGHNPCVPRTKLAYFNVTTFPEQMEQISVDLTAAGGSKTTTAGFKAALNETKGFDIGFYSDAPAGANWTVWAKVPAKLPITDQNDAPILNGQATVSIDAPNGRNGHKAHVTITPTGAAAIGAIYLELHSVLQGGEERIYPVLIAQQ